MTRLHDDILTQICTQIANGYKRHFYLLTGDEGIGKKTVAKTIAKSFLCADAGPNGACGVCKSCHMYDAGTNADLISIEAEDKSILIENTRQMIEDLYKRPLYSKKKVVLIADAHKMTMQAQNSILKTIEEPPAYAVVIMTALLRDMLLETITSRAVHYILKPQRDEIIAQVLDTDNEFALKYGAGNIGIVKKCLDNEFLQIRQKTMTLLELIFSRDFARINESDHLDNFDDSLGILLVMLRDIYMVKKGVNRLINSDIEPFIFKIADNSKDLDILKYVQSIKNAMRLLDINTNKRAVFYNFIYAG